MPESRLVAAIAKREINKMEQRMQVPNTERETLAAVMDQVERDFKSAHEEICRVANLDPKTNTWPAWSPQANSLRWFAAIREKFGL